MKVVWPGVFLGLVMSCVTLGLYYHLIPYTHHLMRTMFLNDVKEVLYSMLKKDKGINNPKLDFIMFVHDVQGRKLIDATFQHRAKGNSARSTTSSSGRTRPSWRWTWSGTS